MQLTNNVQGQDGLKRQWDGLAPAGDVTARTDTHKGWVAPLLAALVLLTAVAVGSLSVWLVPPYLALMSLLLADFVPRSLLNRHHLQPHFAKPEPLLPGNPVDAEAESPEEGSEWPEAITSPEAKSSQEVASEIPDKPIPKAKRSRSKSKKNRAPLAPTMVARWVQVAPGKFVRVEGPSDEAPASDAWEHAATSVDSGPDHTLETRENDADGETIVSEPAPQLVQEEAIVSISCDHPSVMDPDSQHEDETPSDLVSSSLAAETVTDIEPGVEVHDSWIDESEHESDVEEESQTLELASAPQGEWVGDPNPCDADAEELDDEFDDRLEQNAPTLSDEHAEHAENVNSDPSDLEDALDESLEQSLTELDPEPWHTNEVDAQGTEPAWNLETATDPETEAEDEEASSLPDQDLEATPEGTPDDEAIEESALEVETSEVSPSPLAESLVNEADEEWRAFEAEYNRMYPTKEAEEASLDEKESDEQVDAVEEDEEDAWTEPAEAGEELDPVESGKEEEAWVEAAKASEELDAAEDGEVDAWEEVADAGEELDAAEDGEEDDWAEAGEELDAVEHGGDEEDSSAFFEPSATPSPVSQGWRYHSGAPAFSRSGPRFRSLRVRGMDRDLAHSLQPRYETRVRAEGRSKQLERVLKRRISRR